MSPCSLFKEPSINRKHRHVQRRCEALADVTRSSDQKRHQSNTWVSLSFHLGLFLVCLITFHFHLQPSFHLSISPFHIAQCFSKGRLSSGSPAPKNTFGPCRHEAKKRPEGAPESGVAFHISPPPSPFTSLCCPKGLSQLTSPHQPSLFHFPAPT